MGWLNINGNWIGRNRGGQKWSSYWSSLLESPNSDIVQWNSLDDIATINNMLITTSIAPNQVAVLVKYKGERIAGVGNISRVQFHNKTKSGISAIKFYTYWSDGTTYHQEYVEDIISKVSDGDGVKTIDLAVSAAVLEGYCLGLFWDGNAKIEVNAATPAAADSIRYMTSEPSDPEAWDARTGIAYKTQIHCLGTAPMVVGIGDSMMESYPLHTSMVDVTRTTIYSTKSWLYKLYALDNRFTYQDCGIGNEQTTDIEARFNRDVVLKKPKLAVINGGINDIANSITKATFLAKWTSIFDMCIAADIIPIVWKMMPCNNLDNTEMATRDEWNADLVTLFNSYTFLRGAQIIDWDATLGVNRATGPSGNLWDISPTYAQGDGTHLNETGQAKLAEVVLAQFS